MDINLQVDKMHVLIECSRMTSKTITNQTEPLFLKPYKKNLLDQK